MITCVGARAYLSVEAQSQVNVRCLPPPLLTLLFEAGSPAEPGAHQF